MLVRDEEEGAALAEALPSPLALVADGVAHDCRSPARMLDHTPTTGLLLPLPLALPLAPAVAPAGSLVEVEEASAALPRAGGVIAAAPLFLLLKTEALGPEAGDEAEEEALACPPYCVGQSERCGVVELLLLAGGAAPAAPERGGAAVDRVADQGDSGTAAAAAGETLPVFCCCGCAAEEGTAALAD